MTDTHPPGQYWPLVPPVEACRPRTQVPATGSAGAGMVLLPWSSDIAAVLDAWERNVENLVRGAIDIDVDVDVDSDSKSELESPE